MENPDQIFGKHRLLSNCLHRRCHAVFDPRSAWRWIKENKSLLLFILARFFLFAQRHESVPLRWDLQCTTTTAAAAAAPYRLCLYSRNKWNKTVCLHRGGLWICVTCIIVHIWDTKRRLMSPFFIIESQPLWRECEDIGAGESHSCLHAELDLITAQFFFCRLWRRKKKSHQVENWFRISIYRFMHARSVHSESQLRQMEEKGKFQASHHIL